jgi:hypothetical protein
MKITLDVLEAYLKCKLKAHLLLAGEHGQPHDDELMLKEARESIVGGVRGRRAPARQLQRCLP